MTQGGAASITMILSIVLRGSERLRCAREEKMVASKAFRKYNEHSHAVLRLPSFLKSGELGRAGLSWAELG